MSKNFYNIGREVSEILVDSLSKYVVGIDEKSEIEGAFLTPYGTSNDISGFKVGIVYDGDISEEIVKADRTSLNMARYATGFEFDVMPISLDWYRGNSENDMFPVKSLLKSGSVFYDKNGTLASLKEMALADDSVKDYNDFVVVPAVRNK